MKSAIDISKWFVNRGLDNPADNLNGNIKLQKLLFFSWLIHYKKFGESLFNDDFYAFQKGLVIETVRCAYRDNYSSLKLSGADESIDSESFESKLYSEFGIQFTEKEMVTLKLTESLFGDATADELVKLSHNSPVWSKYYSMCMKSTPM